MTDHFEKPQLPQRRTQKTVPAIGTESKKSTILTEFLPPPRPNRKSRLLGLSDATGSMAGVWRETRQHIGKMLSAVSELGSVDLRWAAYRDYSDGNDLLQASQWTNDPAAVTQFVNSISCFGGDDWEEAVEYALKWAADEGKATRVILVGDAPPHPQSDFVAQSRRLKDLAIPVYSFVVGSHEKTYEDFAVISEVTNGVATYLRSEHDLIDCIGLTIADDIGGAQIVEEFLNAHGKQISAGSKEFAKRLLEPGR
jgi:hypothetical protein